MRLTLLSRLGHLPRWSLLWHCCGTHVCLGRKLSPALSTAALSSHGGAFCCSSSSMTPRSRAKHPLGLTMGRMRSAAGMAWWDENHIHQNVLRFFPCLTSIKTSDFLLLLCLMCAGYNLCPAWGSAVWAGGGGGLYKTSDHSLVLPSH